MMFGFIIRRHISRSFAVVSAMESRWPVFQEITTGKFTDICLIKDEKDLITFRNEYGIRDGQEIKKILLRNAGVKKRR